MGLAVYFCGERYDVVAGSAFTIGRDGDLVVDDNPYLHRQFLTLTEERGLPMLANSGNRLAATVAAADSSFEGFLGPGGSLPVVFPRTRVSFVAGSTSYEFFIENDDPSFGPPSKTPVPAGETTLGPSALTPDQFMLIIALAERTLGAGARSDRKIPASADAADRLGWTVTKFNRKLDNVCQKLARSGVSGLHGRPGELAGGRRERLVDYAVSTRLVTAADVDLLPSEASE